jgi:hypothetical protein
MANEQTEQTWLVNTKPGFEKPKVYDFGRDGNAFALMAQVSSALKREGHEDVAEEFQKRGMSSHSYDEVLMLCGEYGDLELDDDGEEEEDEEEEEVWYDDEEW